MKETGRTCHIFRVGTINPDAKRPLLLTGLRKPALADVTDPAGTSARFGNNPVAHAPIFYFFPNVCDHAGEFVPQDHWRPVRMIIVVDVEITPADRNCLH